MKNYVKNIEIKPNKALQPICIAPLRFVAIASLIFPQTYTLQRSRLSAALYEVIDMNPKERIELVARLGSVLEQLEGERISIQEMISHYYENREFDRHCTIENLSQIQVEKVNWQMSGGHFYLNGESSRYGISTTNIFSLEATANEITILEKYEAKTARQTKIKPVV